MKAYRAAHGEPGPTPARPAAARPAAAEAEPGGPPAAGDGDGQSAPAPVPAAAAVGAAPAARLAPPPTGRVPAPKPGVADKHRLLALVPPLTGGGTSRAAALALDTTTLDHYWQRIRRIQWRREILKGIREIDPRTGLAR